MNTKFKIFAIFIVIILSENCRKIIRKYNYEEELDIQNEDGINSNQSLLSNIPAKSYNLKNIDNKYKKYLFYDGQDSYEMAKIKVPYDNLIEIKNSDDKKSIIITNYTAVSIENISVNFKLNRNVEVVLFKLDSLRGYSSVEFDYSDIFNDIDVLYTTDLEKADYLYIKENISSLAHERSFRVGWDKGENEFLDKISKIKVKWKAIVRDYGREKYEKGNYECEEAAMRPYIVRLYHAYLLNTSYIISHDDFKELFIKCYLNYDDGTVLSVADKNYYLNKLLSFEEYKFGLYPSGGGLGTVGTAGLHICSTPNIRDVLTENKTKSMIDRKVIYDPILYPEKNFLKVDSLGGAYLVSQKYAYEYGSAGHEFGHNIGFGHSSNFTYGNTKVTVKEFNNKGELVDVGYWMEFKIILAIISYKYFNTLPVRKEFYFRHDDIDSLAFRPKTYCELNGRRTTKIETKNLEYIECGNDKEHNH